MSHDHPHPDTPELEEILQEMLIQYTAWVNGEPVAWNVKKAEAKAALTRLLAKRELEGRIDELNRKMTLHIELLSSKDFKAGFSAALDQIDAANDLRIAQLQQRQAGED
jgi:hypothetical protein